MVIQTHGHEFSLHYDDDNEQFSRCCYCMTMSKTEDKLTMCTSSKTVLQRLKAISIASTTSVEKHVTPADLVIEIPFVLSIQNVKCTSYRVLRTTDR